MKNKMKRFENTKIIETKIIGKRVVVFSKYYSGIYKEPLNKKENE